MNYAALITAIASAHDQALAGAAGAVNRHLILRNWLIGAYLVEFEQAGEDRAKYGDRLFERVSGDLKRRDIQGLGLSMLRITRRFYDLYPQIQQSVVGESPTLHLPVIRQSPIAESSRPTQVKVPDLPRQPRPLVAHKVLEFSWTHLIELLRLEDPWKRAFYENECLKGNWSVRQLQRQIGSLLYERTGLSTDKQAVIDAGRQQATDIPRVIADLIRDPYVLEFTGLAEKSHYLESDLEKALLDHLQSFLLELGTGFCFEARQKRVTVGNEHDYLDLVFYHRILRCHLLIDLKIRPFQHGDVGQIHPVRYIHYEPIPLHLRSSQLHRWRLLHRLHQRSPSKARRARSRTGAIHKIPSPYRAGLLRSFSFTGGRHQEREVSRDRLGKALHQRAIGKLSHGANFYLNYWKGNLLVPGDQPPVGLLLCTDKDQTKVEYATGGLDHQLFVSRYLVALPKPEDLERLIEIDRAVWEQHHGRPDERTS